MTAIDFVFIDGIAIGLLVPDEGRHRFCGATRTLQAFEGLAFGDADEARIFIASRLQSAANVEGVRQ